MAGSGSRIETAPPKQGPQSSRRGAATVSADPSLPPRELRPALGQERFDGAAVVRGRPERGLVVCLRGQHVGYGAPHASLIARFAVA